MCYVLTSLLGRAAFIKRSGPFVILFSRCTSYPFVDVRRLRTAARPTRPRSHVPNPKSGYCFAEKKHTQNNIEGCCKTRLSQGTMGCGLQSCLTTGRSTGCETENPIFLQRISPPLVRTDPLSAESHGFSEQYPATPNAMAHQEERHTQYPVPNTQYPISNTQPSGKTYPPAV
jgi:hypothetical protein